MIPLEYFWGSSATHSSKNPRPAKQKKEALRFRELSPTLSEKTPTLSEKTPRLFEKSPTLFTISPALFQQKTKAFFGEKSVSFCNLQLAKMTHKIWQKSHFDDV